MIKVDIKNPEVTTRPWDINGRSGVARSQEGWAWLPGDPFPMKIKVKLTKDQQAYVPGSYQLAPESLQVVNGLLELGNLHLVPLKSA